MAGQAKSALTHYSGDFATYENTVEEQKKAQGRARIAYEREKEKLREFLSREGKKYDNPSHQAQVIDLIITSLFDLSSPMGMLLRYVEYKKQTISTCILCLNSDDIVCFTHSDA